jgi:hypothetical protein
MIYFIDLEIFFISIIEQPLNTSIIQNYFVPYLGFNLFISKNSI